MMKIIKITAVWCSACLVMQSRFDKVLSNNKLEVISYDYDFDDSEVKKYNVGKVIPVLIIIDENNTEIARLVGEKSIDELNKFVSLAMEE